MNDRERGYLSEPRRTGFTAVVTAVEPLDEGRAAVCLDRTWFYPESGGQPADRGTLGGRAVLDVRETAEGAVRHILDGPLEEGAEVEGRVDWDRRFDHMQQHSGQHLLSRVFVERIGAATVGFHLGEAASTIDLDTPAVDEETLAAVEREANEIVWGNRPIEARTLDRAAWEETVGEGVRSRLPEGVEEVRLVEIAGLDRSTCCGTHCERTGEIGTVKIVGTEKVRETVRVSFLCGRRAWEDYAQKHEEISALAGRFTTDWREVGRLVERLADEHRDMRKRLDAADREAAAARGRELAVPDVEIEGTGIVKRVLEGIDPGELRTIATAVRDEGDRVALLGLAGERPSLVFACTPGLPLDMGAVLRAAAAVMGAKGGGGPDLAQGGGGDPDALGRALDEGERLVREALEG